MFVYPDLYDKKDWSYSKIIIRRTDLERYDRFIVIMRCHRRREIKGETNIYILTPQDIIEEAVIQRQYKLELHIPFTTICHTCGGDHQFVKYLNRYE